MQQARHTTTILHSYPGRAEHHRRVLVLAPPSWSHVCMASSLPWRLHQRGPHRGRVVQDLGGRAFDRSESGGGDLVPEAVPEMGQLAGLVAGYDTNHAETGPLHDKA